MKKIILCGLLCLVPMSAKAEDYGDVSHDMCWEFLRTTNRAEYNGWVEGYFFSLNLKLLSENKSYVSIEQGQSMVADYCKVHPNIHFADAVDYVFNELKSSQE